MTIEDIQNYFSYDVNKEHKNTRLVLAGRNSSGKTYLLNQINKLFKTNSIYISNEIKSDEQLKVTKDSTLIDWLDSLNNGVVKNNLFDEINKKIIECFKGKTINVDLENEIIKNNEIDVSLRAGCKSFKNLLDVNIVSKSNDTKNPGSGERFYAQLLVIEFLIKHSINRKYPYSYLIIDEPETFLHKSLLIKVASLLKNISKMNVGVIISTHSEEFIKHFVDDLSEIVLVKNCNYIQLPSDNKIIDEIKNKCFWKDFVNKPINWSNVDIYFKHFVKFNLIKSLFTNSIFLCEGFSDKPIYDLWLLMNIDSANMNVDCIETYGKNFMPIYISILRLISDDIKIFALFDNDNEDNWNKKLNSFIKDNSNAIYKFNPCIEDELCLSKGLNKKQTAISIFEKFLTNDSKIKDLINRINSAYQEMFVKK